MFISYISKGNGVIYTDTNPIFKSSIAAIAFLNIFRPFRLAKGVIYHKEKNTDSRVSGFECFDRLHVEGAIGR